MEKLQEAWEHFIFSVIDRRKVPPDRIAQQLNELRALFLLDNKKAEHALKLIAEYRSEEEEQILSQIIIAS